MNYDQDSLSQWHFRHDALEAFSSFSAARNLFFWITVVGMLIIQGVFWAVDQGEIYSSVGSPQNDNIQIYNTIPGNSINTQSCPQGFVLCKNNPEFSFCQDVVAPETETTPEVDKNTHQEKEITTAKTAKGETSTLEKTLRKTMQISRIIVSFSIILYCVCQLLCVQLTLTGSLGGMSLSTNAFFFALVAALFILPWQRSMIQGMYATLFTFDDITKYYSIKSEISLFSYYSRFILLWAIAFILLCISQWRSCQAVKQITARIKEWKTVNPLSHQAPVQQVAPPQPAAIPLAAQTGAPITGQPTPQQNYQQPQNPNDTGYDNSPIPIE